MSNENLAWEKMGGLIPAIVQDSFDGRVLMQGYMNQEALDATLESGKVTFCSGVAVKTNSGPRAKPPAIPWTW